VRFKIKRIGVSQEAGQSFRNLGAVLGADADIDSHDDFSFM
jgi:hypothetical protein